MKLFRSYLNKTKRPRMSLVEASFRAEDLQKVCRNFGSLLSKGTGAPLRTWTVEDFERSGEKGTGVRLANVNGHMFRLNFSNTVGGFANNKAIVLSSIDYWEPGNKDLQLPSVTCKFAKDVNIVQIWNKLSPIIRNAEFGKYTAKDLGGVNEDVARGSIRARKDFLASKGLAPSRGMSPSKFADTLASNGLEDEWNEYIASVEPGQPETNTTEARLQAANAKMKQTKYADPDVVFKDIVTLTKVLIKGKRKLLSICGMGGLGKTFEVTHTLTGMLGDPPNDKWVYIPAGRFSPLQFFQEVLMARDRIICFDEADNIIKKPEIVTMLKPALDTSGDGQVTYNTNTKRMTDMAKKDVEKYCDEVDYWLGQGLPIFTGKQPGKGQNVVGSDSFNEEKEPTHVWLPSKFYFTGKMIIISNLALDEIDNALLTRGSRIDVTLTLEGKVKRVQTVLRAMGYPEDQVDTIVGFLEEQEDPDYISVRTAVAFIDFTRSDEVGSIEEAARLAAAYG